MHAVDSRPTDEARCTRRGRPPGAGWRGPYPHKVGRILAFHVEPDPTEWLSRSIWRDGLVVFAVSLGLRLVYAALTAGTYDPDEFVILALGRDMAHGAVPYRDFMFFHPPGMLVLSRALQPPVALWWPAARVFTLLIDSVSALLVWRIGTLIYKRREALVAGLLYGASPLALLGAVRIGQDPLITALGLMGLLILLQKRSAAGALLAGVFLGLAVWFKYPALLFLPVYALAAPWAWPIVVGSTMVTVAAAFGPFASEAHPLYTQSVEWQLGRVHADLWHRVVALLSFWVVLNPLALPGLWRRRYPWWVALGFALGVLFLFAPEVYYHYLIPVAPFAALLSAPFLVRLLQRIPRLAVGSAVTFLALWAAALNVGPIQNGLGLLQLSATDATVRLLDRVTAPHDTVLADQFEYGFLAHRPQVQNYFWDMHNVTNARTLERQLQATSAVVVTATGSPTYPQGFVGYLEDKGYIHLHAGSSTVWFKLTSGRSEDTLRSMLPRHQMPPGGRGVTTH